MPMLSSPSSAVYDGDSFWVFDSGSGIRFRDDASKVDATLVADSTSPNFMPSATDGHGLFMVVYLKSAPTRVRAS